MKRYWSIPTRIVGTTVPVVATGNRMKRYWSQSDVHGVHRPPRRRNRQQDEEVLELAEAWKKFARAYQVATGNRMKRYWSRPRCVTPPPELKVATGNRMKRYWSVVWVA